MWTDPADDDRVIEWVRQTWRALVPFANGGVYLNFAGFADDGDAPPAATMVRTGPGSSGRAPTTTPTGCSPTPPGSPDGGNVAVSRLTRGMGDRRDGTGRAVAAVIGALVALTGCSDDPAAAPATTAVTPSVPGPPTTVAPSTTTSTVVVEDPGLLRAPVGTDGATLAAAADVVAGRLARMGVADATVTPTPDGVRVGGSADAYQLRAAAQRRPTTLAPVTATDLGGCDGAGTPTDDGTTRCVSLGPPITTTAPVTTAGVLAVPGSGWKLTFDLDGAQYAGVRAALAGAANGPVAVVADDAVVLAFRNNVPALRNAIGPLAEDQARRAAAALVVSDELPVDLAAPPPPPPPGAVVDVDFWTAALGARVCGTWLPNAPAFGLETGVHSHADGLVYVHPFTADEAGDRATLGLFLERGGFQATPDRLQLWDGVPHVDGETCPDGRPAQVRWFVDDVEQHGDPAAHAPRNGQVVVLSYDADATAPGPPPQLAAIPMPVLDVAP